MFTQSYRIELFRIIQNKLRVLVSKVAEYGKHFIYTYINTHLTYIKYIIHHLKFIENT